MSEKRLPQVGEVWWTRNGRTATVKNDHGFHDGKQTLYVHHHKPDGANRGHNHDGAWATSGEEHWLDLVLIREDASGKVINPVFDPALIGKPEAQGKPAKPPKPDPLAQAIAEAKERLAGLEALRQAAQEHANRKGDVKLLAAREKELRVKWLPEKPKAAKAGRKGK